MKKRISASRKKVYARSRKRTPKHLRLHLLFVYSTMGIFGLTLVLTVAQKTFEPFAFGNPSSQYVLGESVAQEQAPTTEKPFYIKIIDIFLP